MKTNICLYVKTYPEIVSEARMESPEIRIPQLPDEEFILINESFSAIHPVLRLLIYLDEHSHRKHYLSDAIIRCGTHKRAFCQNFRQATGTSFAQYMLRLRLHKAAFLFLNSTYTSFDVSCISGFDTFSCFRKYFTLYYGQSPGLYKKAPI